MKPNCMTSQMDTINRRGGPVVGMLLPVLFLPLLGGCLHRWSRGSCETEAPDAQAVASQYYDEVTAHTDNPYKTSTALEVPQSPPPLTVANPEAAEKWEMTLQEALEIALSHLDIVRQIGRGGVATAAATGWESAIAATRVQEEFGRFDANLLMNFFWGKSEEQLLNNVSSAGPSVGPGAIFRNNTFSGIARGMPNSGDVLSITKHMAPGTDVSVGFDTNYSFPTATTPFQRLFPSAYESTLFFTVRQPLLQGRGVDVNRAPIVVARLRADQSLWEFKSSLMQTIRQVEQLYWDLASAQVQLWATDEAIKLNLELVRQLDEKLKTGSGSATDLAEAKLQLHRLRRQRLLVMGAAAGEVSVSSSSARAGGVLYVERQLRGLLGLPSTDGKRIVAIDNPQVAPISLDWQGILGEAFTFNPELQRLKLAVEEQREILLATRNTLKPRLDFFARKEFKGLGAGLDDSIDQQTDNKFGQWTMGFQFEKSLGYNQAAARTQQAMYQVAQSKALLRDKGREIEATLNLNYGSVILRSETYKAAVTARMAAEERLEAQSLLFEKGQVDIDRFLPAVQSYADAVSNEYQDKVEFQTALADLEVTKGTILQYNNIQLHEGLWNAAAYPQAARQAEARCRAIQWRHSRTKCSPEPENMPVYGETEQAVPGADGAPQAVGVGSAPASSNAPASYSDELPLDLRNSDAAAAGQLILVPVSGPADAQREPTRLRGSRPQENQGEIKSIE